MGVRGYFLKKRKLYIQNLTKERKQLPVVILQKSILYNIFIRSLWLRIIKRSDQGVYFPSQIFFNDINHGYRAAILKKCSLWLLTFYMAVATYCYYEKVRRKMRTAILSYLLNDIHDRIFNFFYYFLSQSCSFTKQKQIRISIMTTYSQIKVLISIILIIIPT